MAQPDLPFGDGLPPYLDGDLAGVVVGYSGQAKDYVIPNIPNASLFFELRGADGGDIILGGDLQCVDAGGDGATTQIALKFGTAPGQIAPGGQLRFIVGQEGGGYTSDFGFTSSGGGGGGGTALLYQAPGNSNWEILAVAGGGGGAFGEVRFGACFAHEAPGDGTTGECGSHGRSVGWGEGRCDGNAGQSRATAGGGGGAFGGAGNNTGGGKGHPAGGAGGTGGAQSQPGGWGFGGGGAGGGETGGGAGGGGYSGGGAGGLGGAGGGGGSYVNPGYGYFSDIFLGSQGDDGSIAYRCTTPQNDGPDNALPLIPGQTVIGTAFGSSFEIGSNHCGDVRGNDVFYTYTAGVCDERLTITWSTADTNVSAFVAGAETCLASSGTPIDLGPGQTVLVRVFSESKSFELTSSVADVDSDGDGTCDALDECPLGENADCNENNVTDCLEDLAARTLVAQNFDGANFGHPVVANGAAIAGGTNAGTLARFPGQVGTFVFETPVAGETAWAWEFSFDFEMAIFGEGVALVVMPVADSDDSLLFGSNGVDEFVDHPILEVKFDAINDEQGDPSGDFVKVSSGVGGASITAIPSFNLNGGQLFHALIRYEPTGQAAGNVSVILTPEGGSAETLIDNAAIASINRLGRFALGASTSNVGGGPTDFYLTRISNVQITDFSNGDDRDGDGIPNACDTAGPMPPANGSCADALAVGLGRTPIDTGTGPAWFTITPEFELSCAFDQSLRISIDTQDDSACGDISLQLFCGSAILATGDCSTGVTRALSGAISGEPLYFRVGGAVVGDLVLDYVATNDSDGDGVPDDCDVCPGNNDLVDSDGDGIADGCDLCAGFNDQDDADGDGVPDECDVCPENDDALDVNSNGIPDGCDPCIISNDDCANATPIGEGVVEGCTTDATNDGTSSCSASATTPDVWFAYTASETGIATAGTAAINGAGFNTHLAVFDGCGGAEIIANNNTDSLQSEVSWSVEAGESYMVRVSGNNGDTGQFALTLSVHAEFANDACENATPIGDDDGYLGTTDLATTDGETQCNFPKYDVWFQYTNADDCPKSVTFSTCHDFTDFDTVLSVHDVCGGPAVAWNDDDCSSGSGPSTVTHLVDAGRTVLIRVYGNGGERGIYQLSVTSDISDIDTDGDGVIDCMDSCPNRTAGDVNGDSEVSIDDIASFTTVVLDPDAASADDRCAADVNEDGAVDGLDMQAFTMLLLAS
ncbi:MAG TPA: dockerin type I domain-containing protein [Phycisphaerae bacterium]|nr:dockerin type I domain-containing protein [Phycisphaerae bacterium]